MTRPVTMADLNFDRRSLRSEIHPYATLCENFHAEIEQLRVALNDMTASRDTWKARALRLSDDLSAALEGHD